MPGLQWDELDFMECLEVIPEVEEDWHTYYLYKVRKDELLLTVVVRPLESYVWLSLSQQEGEQPLIEFALFVHGKVRYINDKRGQYLDFADCIMVPDRASYLEEQRLWETAAPNWRVELAVRPDIQIRYLG